MFGTIDIFPNGILLASYLSQMQHLRAFTQRNTAVLPNINSYRMTRPKGIEMFS